jgi:serine/threonine protein kinase
LKLADFGFSEKPDFKGRFFGRKGTPGYISMECDNASSKSSYDGKAADMFAVGATLFVMLSGSQAGIRTDDVYESL